MKTISNSVKWVKMIIETSNTQDSGQREAHKNSEMHIVWF